VNARVEESLKLAYHGARAEKPQFNVTPKRDLDPSAGLVEVFRRKSTRVLLNLISNGFCAVTKRKRWWTTSPYTEINRRQFRQRVQLPTLSQMRGAVCIEHCPSSSAKRKTYARTEFFSV
jgi:hypothetical protein